MNDPYKKIKIKGNFPFLKIKNSIHKSNQMNKRNFPDFSDSLSPSLVIQNQTEKVSKKISAHLPLIKS